MNRKRIGILLVVLAILIGGIAVFTFFVNDQEPKKEKTKVEKETEKEIVTLPEQEEAPEETEEPEEPEGAPEKNVYIEQVQMDLIGLSEETEASIPDREAFDYQIKETNAGFLKVKPVIEESDWVIVQIRDIPEKWAEVSFRLELPGEAGEIINFFCSRSFWNIISDGLARQHNATKKLTGFS